LPHLAKPIRTFPQKKMSEPLILEKPRIIGKSAKTARKKPCKKCAIFAAIQANPLGVRAVDSGRRARRPAPQPRGFEPIRGYSNLFEHFAHKKIREFFPATFMANLWQISEKPSKNPCKITQKIVQKLTHYYPCIH